MTASRPLVSRASRVSRTARQLTPFSGQAAPVYFRASVLAPDGVFPAHRHDSGEFVYAFSGVMELLLDGQHYLAPPQYGVWLPPHTDHVGLNRHEASYCSVYVAADWCTALPTQPGPLTVSPLLRALLEHLRAHPPAWPPHEADARLLQVVVDQLAQARQVPSYLPRSIDPLLAPVLDRLEAAPGDNPSLAELARLVHTTERTLGRRFQAQLGMGLSEWQQRLRVVRALPLLEAGRSVEAVALDLGYSSASAFIAMFKRHTGQTPAQSRQGGV